MPFNEALFWFGITAFGTGLYFLVEASVKRLYSAGLTTIGLLACAYAVYRHYHPEIPAISLWVILLVLTWALLGYDVYLHRFQRLSSEITGISAEQRKRIKLAGVLEAEAGKADWLAMELERVSLRYSKEHETLIRPLGKNTLPDVIQKDCEKRLLSFRSQYYGHIGTIRYHVPDFHSTIMDGPSPREIEYPDLREELKRHANMLRKLAKEIEQEQS
jgi:hypothetical protein